MTGDEPSRFGVRLSSGAQADFAEIEQWIAADRGSDAAVAFIDRLLERIDHLRTFPLRGEVPAEAAAMGLADVRQIIVAPYRVVYRVIENMVYITLIAHGRRDLGGLLQKRLLRPPAID